MGTLSEKGVHEGRFHIELADSETPEEADFEALQMKMQDMGLSPADVIKFLDDIQADPRLIVGGALTSLTSIRGKINAAVKAKQLALGEDLLGKFEQLQIDVLASPVSLWDCITEEDKSSQIPQVETDLILKDLVRLFGVSLLSVEREGDVAPEDHIPADAGSEDCVMFDLPIDKIAYLTTSDGCELRVTCSPKDRKFTVKLSTSQSHLFA